MIRGRSGKGHPSRLAFLAAGLILLALAWVAAPLGDQHDQPPSASPRSLPAEASDMPYGEADPVIPLRGPVEP